MLELRFTGLHVDGSTLDVPFEMEPDAMPSTPPLNELRRLRGSFCLDSWCPLRPSYQGTVICASLTLVGIPKRTDMTQKTWAKSDIALGGPSHIALSVYPHVHLTPLLSPSREGKLAGPGWRVSAHGGEGVGARQGGGGGRGPDMTQDARPHARVTARRGAVRQGRMFCDKTSQLFMYAI